MSTPSDDYSEDALVERPAVALLASLGWEAVNAYAETFGEGGTLGRATRSEVVLRPHLRRSLRRLNPGLPDEALRLAEDELARDRAAMTLVQANRAVYALLKNGVPVTYQDPEKGEVTETVQVIDWQRPEAGNDFLLAQQLWVTGPMYTRRADLVGFVNGLPLLFIELKASHRRLEDAYRGNLRDYKQAIPHLFHYNAAVLLSNGSESRLGSVTAAWEHFGAWKRISNEEEEGVVSLETILRGTATPARLLDLAENFVLFEEARGGVNKIVGKNHQVLGVNNAVDAVRSIEANQGKLGVFWHTQGSGKSFSMAFFAQKVLRKRPGNWSFVVVTDRTDLDEQIYKTFARTGIVTKEEAQATSSAHLRGLLREDHRFVFTLIQKFRTEDGQRHPTLSERDDVIVMVDEAHRTQYDVLAQNMRDALPNAAFIAFTGTPLLAEEEKTRAVFGDYVSVYDFQQSIQDGATVPLYYENRIPELQLTNDQLNEDIADVIEAADLDERQERKLERELGREYHLLTREDRLDKVGEDLVQHFLGRGYRGKAMVVSIDKATALRTHDMVQKHWQREIDRLKKRIAALKANPRSENDVETFHETSHGETPPDGTPPGKTSPGKTADALLEQLHYMQETEMAVVVSQAQNEIADMAEKGLDIAPHRARVEREDLDERFKDPDDPFRLVFVCAMWMTGFDVPNCATIYLDKPMRNHTLMQTIARANRTYEDKQSGLIVDYAGVFRNLQQALALYAGVGREADGDDTPIQKKGELVEALREAIQATRHFLAERGVEPEAIQQAEGFDRIRAMDDAVEAILESDETKRAYLAHTRQVDALFKAILPDPAASTFGPDRTLFVVLAQRIRSLDPEVDISAVRTAIEDLLDDSVAAEGYVIRDPGNQSPSMTSDPAVPYRTDGLVDLSRIDFDALREQFERGRKRIEAEKLRGKLNQKVKAMVRLNRTRMDYLETFQELIEAYNMGSQNVEAFFEQMLGFMETLRQEETRPEREGLSEEELALCDLITQPADSMTDADQKQVKDAARDLLTTLKREALSLDWRKKQQSRAAVRVVIESLLDEQLPSRYDADLFQAVCDAVYEHVYDAYPHRDKNRYATQEV